jgi:hypothetical protein
VNNNNRNVWLGLNSEYTTGEYDGLLDDVRIYARPLSQSELAQILNATVP